MVSFYIAICPDPLLHEDVCSLVKFHIEALRKGVPPESVHALAIEDLRKPDITFWTARSDQALCGCAALKELDKQHGELKSMRTSTAFLRQGIGQALMDAVFKEASQRGYGRLSLETGTTTNFGPALRMYERNGFVYCEPFGSYKKDPHSIFMTKKL